MSAKDVLSSSGQRLYDKARRIIPGGTQLLSKRPEMFLPEQWPSYYIRAKGVEVWDLDGNRYVDMGYCGVGACVLGFADPDVDAAVHQAIDSGNMATLNCPEEVELADLLCELHPWAEMVRFARSGGEAMAIAVRIARARTGRDRVAFCGYHGWHDWYLAANLAEKNALSGHLLSGLEPNGVPRALAGSAVPFHYNHLEELKRAVAGREREFAAVVLEPVRDHDPEPGFLEGVREIASHIGAILIVDEITSGWRMNSGGIHLTYALRPDVAVFAKAMGNGYAIAAVIGKADVMQAAQTTFISSTNWTEKIGPVAALATIRKHQTLEVPKHLVKIGRQIQLGWRSAAQRAGLPVEIGGIPPLGHLGFRCENSAAVKTLFVQLMLDKGFLATNAFYATYAHQEEHVEKYLSVVEEAFSRIAAAQQRGEVEKLLRGPTAHTGFSRLT
jgi:glutamate-1-semialdehyde 2,1-aminomutase